MHCYQNTNAMAFKWERRIKRCKESMREENFAFALNYAHSCLFQRHCGIAAFRLPSQQTTAERTNEPTNLLRRNHKSTSPASTLYIHLYNVVHVKGTVLKKNMTCTYMYVHLVVVGPASAPKE